jgi:hypothetical protein
MVLQLLCFRWRAGIRRESSYPASARDALGFLQNQTPQTAGGAGGVAGGPIWRWQLLLAAHPPKPTSDYSRLGHLSLASSPYLNVVRGHSNSWIANLLARQNSPPTTLPIRAPPHYRRPSSPEPGRSFREHRGQRAGGGRASTRLEARWATRRVTSCAIYDLNRDFARRCGCQLLRSKFARAARHGICVLHWRID